MQRLESSTIRKGALFIGDTFSLIACVERNGNLLASLLPGYLDHKNLTDTAKRGILLGNFLLELLGWVKDIILRKIFSAVSNRSQRDFHNFVKHVH